MQPVTDALEAETQRRRDPAPSRWQFRLQRWWLTPYVRRMVRLGFPLLTSLCGLLWFFSIEANRAALQEQMTEIRRSVAERPEFMVKAMAIEGATSTLDQDIRELLPIDFPISSFDLDLDLMKDAVEKLDAVAAADLAIRPGGILQMDVTERLPVLIWRNRDALVLLDATGHRVAAIASRTDHPDLPLVVGEGADAAVAEAMALIAAAEPLEARLRGLVRMGERRWDIVLDRDQTILLPEDLAVPALEQVIAIDQAREVLERNVSHVDMRNPSRPTLRLAAPALEELYRIRSIELRD